MKQLTAVSIAKDTLKWLTARRFNVTEGVYCDFSPKRATNRSRDIARDVQDKYQYKGLQKLLHSADMKKVKCEVCARGALFIAVVDKTNECEFKEYGYAQRDTTEKLLSYFSHEQLVHIECAFERDNCFAVTTGIGTDRVEQAVRFGRKYKTPRGRLRAICNNIIENNGVFKP